jgi:hypothetical protein
MSFLRSIGMLGAAGFALAMGLGQPLHAAGTKSTAAAIVVPAEVNGASPLS